MTRSAGQILRGVGLLIELLGVIAVLTQSRTSTIPQITLPGREPFSIGWIAVVLGFVVWLIGQIVIRMRPG